MPAKRRRSKGRCNIDSDEWAYLLDEPEPADANPFTYMGLDIDFEGRASTLWREHGEAATAEYVSKHLGQRPRLWWRYSVVEPRRQVGGATSSHMSQGSHQQGGRQAPQNSSPPEPPAANRPNAAAS
jgi:hypothetical protein